MTEKERYEEDILKNCIQEAYGYSDDQLLAELEEIEKSLSDDEFPGLEERMYGKLMERIRAEENTENSSKSNSELEHEENVKESAPVVRIGKKKVLVIGILAAAFIGVLGGTAIGDRNYLLKEKTNHQGIVFDNENNLNQSDNLKLAYDEIKKTFGGECLALYYMPQDMRFLSHEQSQSKETLVFEYLGNQIYFIQMKQTKVTSISMQSDRVQTGIIKNTWLNKELEYSENLVKDNEKEYESQGEIGKISYWICGKMEKKEFEDILKALNYY